MHAGGRLIASRPPDSFSKIVRRQPSPSDLAMPSLAEQLSNAGSSLVTSPVRMTAIGVGLCPAWKMETGAFPITSSHCGLMNFPGLLWHSTLAIHIIKQVLATLQNKQNTSGKMRKDGMGDGRRLGPSMLGRQVSGTCTCLRNPSFSFSRSVLASTCASYPYCICRSHWLEAGAL